MAAIIIKTTLIVIILYILLLWDFRLKITTKNSTLIINYNGLVWVALDKYSMLKYKMKNSPIKWIDWNYKIEINLKK